MEEIVTLEQKTGKGSVQGLEDLVEKKGQRLPKSVRKYLRDLKADGKWEEAMRIGRQARERKAETRQKKAEETLNRTIRELLESTDPQVEAEHEVKAIWLLEAAGVIDSEERLREILESLDTKGAELKAILEENLARIRDEVKPFMPSRLPPPTQTRFHR